MAGYLGTKAVLLSTTAADVTGNAEIGGDLTVGGNVTLGDNDKAIFGAGSDLQIYHDGNNRLVTSGDLLVNIPDGDEFQVLGSQTASLRATATGSVRLFYNGAEKLATSNTGVNVTGSFTSTGIDDNAAATAMTLDSSGNLLVGKTVVDNTTQGARIYPTGRMSLVSEADDALILNRRTTDGDIAVFRKDNTTVGSIGAHSGSNQTEISIAASTGAGLMFGNRIQPMEGNARADNVVDFGSGTYRFDDIYATNGTIQTSDRNEKQDIEVLSEAETRVAVACKGLLRKFRWQDAVAEKGDDARIHFGIIAQDLQDAFTAEGLDAGRYAMFISSTWWETQTEVPAVEADEQNGVEAKEAYTRTDTYETLEEAPEGATERTRLGVRYPELLAFIIGAM